MQKIIKMNLPFIREELSPAEARERIASINEPYKLEILGSILERDPAAPITIYHIGENDHPAHWWVGVSVCVGGGWGGGGCFLGGGCGACLLRGLSGTGVGWAPLSHTVCVLPSSLPLLPSPPASTCKLLLQVGPVCWPPR